MPVFGSSAIKVLPTVSNDSTLSESNVSWSGVLRGREKSFVSERKKSVLAFELHRTSRGLGTRTISFMSVAARVSV